MKILQSFATIVLALWVGAAAAAAAVEGLIMLKSPHSVAVTMDRLEDAVKKRELKVFARIDHAAGAASIGQSLRPTQLLIFGNPQGGTPFMACAQTVRIDLPLKALVWEDAAGQVWLGYKDPPYLAKRHVVADCLVAAKLDGALAGIVGATVAK